MSQFWREGQLEESPHWGEGANFGEKGGGNLVGEDASAAPRFQR